MNRIITGSIFMVMMIIVNVRCSLDNQSKTYYISPEGNDESTGLSKNTAWSSIGRINRETYQPGDKILFK